MSAPLLISFLVSFVGGPLLCSALLALPRSLFVLLVLAGAVVVSMTLALRFQGGRPVLSLGLIWLGWVLAVAMVALAVMRRAPQTRRWVTVIALLATTLPWFGLATARLMV